MDGLDQVEGITESDEESEVCGDFFAAQGNAPEAFEVSDGLIDPRPSPVECPCKSFWPVFRVLSVGTGSQEPLLRVIWWFPAIS